MNEILDPLNSAQREAVESTEGYVRVIAGAGSGKTRALTHRFAYLTGVLGVLPSDILCVTFTNKAASEMRRRIRALTGDSDTGLICTFHSFCVTVLSEEAHCVGYPEKFLVLDNGDIDAMLAIIYEERGLTLRDMTFADARDMFEMRKTHRDPDYYRDMIALPLDILKEKYANATELDDILFLGYLYMEKKCFALDYNDLIMFTLHIFDTYPEVKLKWQKRLEYIMIDEFQDIDPPQYRLMKALCGYHNNLFVVGDPDQTIYTWRGADIRFLNDFDREFPDVKTIFLNRNYRSTPEILAAANSLISKNVIRIEKDLEAVRPSGPRPRWIHCTDVRSEAEAIASETADILAKGYEYRDIAVLYRSHYVSRSIEETFIRRKIPYTVWGGVGFYERSEVKDALSYLRFIAFLDDLSFSRIINRPKRNIGKRRLSAIKEHSEKTGASFYESLRYLAETDLFRSTDARAFIEFTESFRETAREKPISDLLSELLDKSGYEAMLRTEGSGERLDNLAELKQSVYDYETTCGEESTLESFLEHIALYTASDMEDSKNNVRLMTVHAAKGLEFPAVIISSLNEDVFPSKKTATRASMEEERRLCFVAVTRAKDLLTITDSEGYEHDRAFRLPSRFIGNIGKNLLECINEPDETVTKQTENYVKTSESVLSARDGDTECKPGDRIRHAVLGYGTVTGIDRNKGCYIIKFDSMPTERKVAISLISPAE